MGRKGKVRENCDLTGLDQYGCKCLFLSRFLVTHGTNNSVKNYLGWGRGLALNIYANVLILLFFTKIKHIGLMNSSHLYVGLSSLIFNKCKGKTIWLTGVSGRTPWVVTPATSGDVAVVTSGVCPHAPVNHTVFFLCHGFIIYYVILYE